MRVIVHIGSTKTGSSAVQRFMDDHRDALRAAGVLYPAAGILSGAHHLFAAMAHQGAWRMHRDVLGEPPFEQRGPLCTALAEEVAGFAGDTVVLSSEYLWTVREPGQFAELLQEAGIGSFEVLCYVREISEWLLSHYGQGVRSGNAELFRPWLTRMLRNPHSGADYAGVAERWQAVAAVSGVSARVYSEASLPEGVIPDFLRHVGLDPGGFAIDGYAHVNPSPGEGEVLLLAALNASDTPEPYRALMRQIITDRGSQRAAFEPAGRLDPPDINRVAKAYEAKLAAFTEAHVAPEHRDVPLLRRAHATPRERSEVMALATVRLVAGLMRTLDDGR